MKTPKHYIAKTLFPGSVIGKEGNYVAIPEKGFKGSPILVKYDGKEMLIKDWLRADSYRRFPDKWGRGTYTLGYFKWKPDES